jgi:NAD/NADP transhydrogenase alpha subunit
MLGQIGGQYEPTQDHAVKHLIESTTENVIIISMVIWLLKRMFHRPLASLVFILGTVATVVTAERFQRFYPPIWIVIVIALIGLGRVIR